MFQSDNTRTAADELHRQQSLPTYEEAIADSHRPVLGFEGLADSESYNYRVANYENAQTLQTEVCNIPARVGAERECQPSRHRSTERRRFRLLEQEMKYNKTITALLIGFTVVCLFGLAVVQVIQLLSY